MQPVQSPDMCSPRACLTTETRGVAHITYREVSNVKDHITVNVGNRDFRCWYHIKVVDAHIIHLSLFVRQLSGAKAGIFIYHYRRFDLAIACFAGFIEEEVNQCSLQPGSFAFIDRESCSCDLYSQVKVNDIIFFYQVPV